MACILVGENGLVSGDAPIYAKAFVKDADASICLGVVELVALVLEDGRLAEYGKTMCKTLGYKELAMVLGSEFHCNVLTIGGRSLAYVYGYIQHSTLYTSHQFALRVWRALEVETSHHAIGTHAFVVLDKVHGTNLLIELALGEGFKEISAGILEYTGFKDKQSLNACLNYFHLYKKVSVRRESWS